MTAEPAGLDRCPKCGAAVRFGDPWCTLCYADLRPPPPEPEPEPEPQPAAVTPPPRPDPLTDPLTVPAPAPTAEAVAGPSWPCSSCGTVNPMARDTCSSCGLHFLAGLRGQDGPLLELPVVGDITQLTRGKRFALAGAVVLAVILLTLFLGLLFG